MVLAYPVGATLAIQALGPLVGTDPQWATTVQDVVLGAAGGVVVGAVVGTVGAGVGYLAQVAVTGDADYVFVGPGIGILLGGVVGAGTMLNLTARRVRVEPAALAAPTGERVSGVTLSIPL